MAELKTFIDLFAGIGGFHVAMAERGLKCVFASEIDIHAADSYEANFGLKPHGDITQINACDIPPHDVLCAGFPCQPFSNSGNNKGLDDVRGGLFREIARIAKACKPKVLLLENVPSILNMDRGNVLQAIIDALDDAGFRVEWSVLNSGAYGVPQARIRVFFVCIRKDLPLTFTPPKPLPPSAFKCVNDILLPDSETADLILPRDDIFFNSHISDKKIFQLKKIGYVGKPKSKLRSSSYSQCYRVFDPMGLMSTQMAISGGVGKTTGLIHIKNNPHECERIWSTKQLTKTQIANWIAAESSNGELYLTNGKVRTLHIKEALQVMGFDKNHIVSDGTQGFKQTGNAVVPACVGAVFDGIKEPAPRRDAEDN